MVSRKFFVFGSNKNRQVEMKDNKKNKNKSLLTILNGFFMGLADSVPGISGGTIALILGIYEQLISSISFFFSNLLKIRKLVRSNEFKFLVKLVVGIAIGILLSLKTIDFLIKNYESSIFSFFTGLIIASVFVVTRRVLRDQKQKNIGSLPRESKSRKRNIMFLTLFVVLGFLFGFLISSLDFIINNHSLFMIFFSGIFAISAMILPGISGAYILVLLNQYSYIVNAVSDIHLSIILVFIVGCILGLAMMSKFLKYLLSKHYEKTMFFLIGLMIGGLKSPIANINNSISLLIFGTIGFFLIILLDRSSIKSLR